MFENKLPFSEFDIFQTSDDPKKTSTLNIAIQSRKARLSDNPSIPLKQPNCWRYIREGSKEESNPDPLDVFIGPVLSVRRDVPVTINFTNTLESKDMLPNGPMLAPPPINPPMMMKNMNPSVGVVVHLHGGKVQSTDDGWPLVPMSFTGNPYHVTGSPEQPFTTTASYHYPNKQRAAMLWFHDHGMDNTAPQVHAGLAALYFIRDDSDDQLFGLLGGTPLDAEIPLVIQDRVLNCDANGFDYWAGLPTKNPQYEAGKLTAMEFQRPEFLGDTILVNGRAWPHHAVTQKRYRLRILNGSNARTYALALVNSEYWTGQCCSDNQKIWYSDKLTVIGNDGGLFATKKTLSPDDYLVLAPGERLDLILDLTDVCPDEVSKLRLVNLAVGSLARGEWPEGIFQHEGTGGSILKPSAAPDNIFLNTLLAIRQANIMQFCVGHHAANHGHDHGHGHGGCNCQANAAAIAARKQKFMAGLDKVLMDYANSQAGQDGFHFQWNYHRLGTENNVDVSANRLVVLMNNTKGLGDADTNPYTVEGKWHDTQIWEMGLVQSGSSLTPFQIPFDTQLGGIVQGNPASPMNYQVMRSTFFAPATQAEVITKEKGAGFNKEYPPLQPAAIKPKQGTYERWYVANLGNWQPADGAQALQTPDMHPFHMHLVNFVVLRRFALKDNGDFTGSPKGKNAFDGEVRHDTVRINSNELVELLVYFPKDYTGDYPYHCHLVEHEDMGMMLHFDAQP